MTASIGPQGSTRPVQAAPPRQAAEEVRRGPSRVWLAALGVILLFVATYAFAWFQANRLSSRFIVDADTSYSQGKYVDALVGYEKFDQARNVYVTHGGYVQVERIWSNRYSWPVPPALMRARQRSEEIINKRLTAADAEQYIQANTGKPGAPYFGEMYVRLGELYAQEGDAQDARDIFSSVEQLFPNRPDLIQRAHAGLQALGSG